MHPDSRFQTPVFTQRKQILPFSSIQTPIRAIKHLVNTPAVTDQPLPNPPIICRLAVALLGILVALSALPWSYYSLNHFGGFNWGLLGFELVTLLAGIFGILFGLGKFRSGWAIGVTAIAGAILVAMVFGIYVDFVMATEP